MIKYSCQNTEADQLVTDSCAIHRYNGFVDELTKFVEKDQLLREDLWNRFAGQFKEDSDFDAGWRGEYWGKMMRGACFTYAYTRNPELYRVLSETVRDLMGAADSNGRISTYAVSHEFDGWDLWSRKYVLLGMQYFVEICDDKGLSKEIVASMCAQLDYIISKIGPEAEGKKSITSATRHWRGLNSSSLLEPVVRLYNMTQEQKYLDFASYIVECGGTDVVNIFELALEDKLYPYQYPVTKAYEMTSCFEGLLEYYRVTKIEKYKTAVINFANKVLESDFTVIGSGSCSHELFDHSAVRQSNFADGFHSQETCVTVTLMKFFYQLTLLTGDPKFVDSFELALYNAYYGAINTERIIEPAMYSNYPECLFEALTFDSYSPLAAGRRGTRIGGLKVMSDNHYYGCCACIGSAGNGLVPKMALMKQEKGFAYNLFIDGTIQTVTAGGQTITFTARTSYPADGRVRISLQLERPEAFALSIRNPHWNKLGTLTVNGESVHLNDGYTTVTRLWSDGDLIVLDMDMRTRVTLPIYYGSQVLMTKVIWGKNYVIPEYDAQDPQAMDRIALTRGPIALAQDSRLGWDLYKPAKIKIREDGFVDAQISNAPIAPYSTILEVTVPTENGEIHLTDYSSAGKLWSDDCQIAAWILNR